MDYLKNKANNLVQGVSNFISNPKTVSTFYETGQITPSEFIEAGDKLVTVNSNWKWSKAESESKQDKSLFPDRQYLVAQIPVLKRADIGQEEEVTITQDGDWVSIDRKVKEGDLNEEIPVKKETPTEVRVVNIDDELDGDDDETPIEADINKRTYILNITYDQYYKCARLWLSGIDYKGDTLSKEQIFEEVMSEYKDKTMTFENHPHISKQMASLHPCKHADVMKKLCDQAQSNGKKLPVNTYLFIFLKFINSVMPNLPVDYTTEIEL